MVFDSLQARTGGQTHLAPMEIAHHSLLTAREKIELLNDLKTRAGHPTGVDETTGYSAHEVDEAINEVRLGSQRGEQTQTVLFGDN